MADEQENELELDKSGKKKKMIIIIAIVLVLILGGGGGYFLFMGDASQEEVTATLSSGEEASAPVEASAASTGSALYVPMPRPFRFNVPGSARDRFVEIRVQLLVRGSDDEEEAKKHVPLIESTLLNVFSLANADDLATSAGKQSLKQQSLAEVQKTMTDISGSSVVEQVLFTGFVMQ